jgi:hypothetical protein
VITNNPRLTDVGSEANRQRARQAGRQQAVLARMAAARAARGWHHCRRQPNHCRGGLVMIKRLISRAAVWAGRRRPGEAARAGEDPCVEREIAPSLTDEALAWAVGTWRKRYL